MPRTRPPAKSPGWTVDRVLDFACDSGSLRLNVRNRMEPHDIGRIYGREKNTTTYDLARMNMLLHGFHFLSDEGTMAIILPHGVLFRGGAEKRFRNAIYFYLGDLDLYSEPVKT